MNTEEKRMAGDYEIVQALHIGDREIVMGINKNDSNDLPYLVAFYESNGIFGRYYDVVGTDDFIENVECYGQRIKEQAEKTRQELDKPKLEGIDMTPITAADCTVVDRGVDINDKVIVIKAEALRPEYRRSTRQVKLCVGGFGADSNSRGSAVFCIDLYDGKESRYERMDVLGVLEPEQIPEWAKKRLAAMKDEPKKEQKPKSKERER